MWRNVGGLERGLRLLVGLALRQLCTSLLE